MPIDGLMQPGGSNGPHKDARAAVLALHAALTAYRQHPDAPGLWRKALRRAAATLERATSDAPLHLSLRSGAVHVGDEPVVPFRSDQAPFGLLRSAGVGELALARGSSSGDCERLVVHLCGMANSQDTEHELHALLDTAHLPGVALRAAADLPDERADDRASWDALPPPAATVSATLRAQVQRDDTSNLPALAARQLLDDCEHIGTAHGGLLDQLMQRLLSMDDVATVTWLLTEARRQTAFDRDVVERLAEMARAHCDDAWLHERLDRGTHEELLQLCSLVMQLGDDVAERFANAAAEIAHPLSQWLGELLGR